MGLLSGAPVHGTSKLRAVLLALGQGFFDGSLPATQSVVSGAVGPAGSGRLARVAQKFKDRAKNTDKRYGRDVGPAVYAGCIWSC